MSLILHCLFWKGMLVVLLCFCWSMMMMVCRWMTLCYGIVVCVVDAMYVQLLFESVSIISLG